MAGLVASGEAIGGEEAERLEAEQLAERRADRVSDQCHPAGAQAWVVTSDRVPNGDQRFGVGRVIAARTNYWSEYGLDLWCPECLWNFEPEDDERAAAMEPWEQGEPTDEVSCPGCGLSKRLQDWDGDWGFGELGLELWGFPDLSCWFVREVSRLTGSRVTLARGAR